MRLRAGGGGCSPAAPESKGVRLRPRYSQTVWPRASLWLSLSLSFSMLKIGVEIPGPCRALCAVLESPGHPVKAATIVIIIVTIMTVTLPNPRAPERAITEFTVPFNKAQ